MRCRHAINLCWCTVRREFRGGRGNVATPGKSETITLRTIINPLWSPLMPYCAHMLVPKLTPTPTVLRNFARVHGAMPCPCCRWSFHHLQQQPPTAVAPASRTFAAAGATGVATRCRRSSSTSASRASSLCRDRSSNAENLAFTSSMAVSAMFATHLHHRCINPRTRSTSTHTHTHGKYTRTPPPLLLPF